MLIKIDKESVAECWIEALQRVFFDGDRIPTEYDWKTDFPSFDVSSAIQIRNPLSKPFKVGRKVREVDGYIIYCHPADVYCVEAIKGSDTDKTGYLREVMSGNRDKDIWDSETSYPYTYHDRLYNYRALNVEDEEYVKDIVKDLNAVIASITPVDQIERIIEKLKSSPYSRRCQAVTWRPLADQKRGDPPCLIRVWCRVFDGKLRVNVHWRSRDLFGAWEANINAIIQIGLQIAEGVGCELGEIYDFCDSLHVYGRKKLVFKELIPLLETVRNREGLVDDRYNDMLDGWIGKEESYS